MLVAERKGVMVGRMRETASLRASCRPSSSRPSSRSSTGNRAWERDWRREGRVLGKRAANTSRATPSARALPFWTGRGSTARSEHNVACTHTHFLELVKEVLLQPRQVSGLKALQRRGGLGLGGLHNVHSVRRHCILKLHWQLMVTLTSL